MFIIDPIKFENPTFNRPTIGTYFDDAGFLQNAAVDQFRITYDPKDLTSGPIALVEGASTNVNRNNSMQGAVVGVPGTEPANWSATGSWNGITRSVVEIGSENNIDYVVFGFSGIATGITNFFINTDSPVQNPAASGQTWAGSAFLGVSASSVLPATSINLVTSGRGAGGVPIENATLALVGLNSGPLSRQRYQVSRTLDQVSTQSILQYIQVTFQAGETANLQLRIGLPQLEQGAVATSPMRTAGAALTRAADVVGSGAGLLYSNVAMTEPAYSSTATYAAADVVRDPATNDLYESVGANNVGNALTDKSEWIPRGATNRWKMLDQYNNTQTQNADQIVMVLSPGAIAQGIFLAGLDAMDVSMVMQDPVEGIVYREKQSQVLSSSRSSYFNWMFKRILRKSYCVSVLLPPYWGALVTVVIKKLGSTAKCGVFALGPIVDVGLAEYGLSTEIKDYSSTTFEFDGTSTTVLRDFAKRMSVDVAINNEYIDTVQETLANYRQKPVVWVGTVLYGSAIVFGRYSSFKNIIQSQPESKMALAIDGTV